MKYINSILQYINESASDSVIANAITNVISDKKKSKDYPDLFIDSNGYTAVGILHFTKSGLKNLYNTMNTMKYFSRDNDEMIDSIKTYAGKEIEDKQWKEGMEKFLNSKESIPIQNKAALSKFKPYFNKYADGWSTERQYAIGVSIINSSPKNFVDFGNEYGWDAEKMMYAYCKFESDKHVKRGKKDGRCRTRCRKLNDYYTYNGDTNKYYFKGCSDLKLENPFDHTIKIDNEVTNDISKQTIITAQTKFKELGYNLGTFGPNKDGIDGELGTLTNSAIGDYQNKNGLEKTGILDEETMAKLSGNTTTKKDNQIVTNQVSGNLIIFSAGLDNRPNDLSLDQHIEALEKTTGKKINGYRYNDKNGFINAIKANPQSIVVMFSAGNQWASSVASASKNKNNVYMIEPFNSGPSGGTHKSVNLAIKSGVPSKNVIIGPSNGRGNGIIDAGNGEPSHTPSGIGHWGSLKNFKENNNIDKEEVTQNINNIDNKEINLSTNIDKDKKVHVQQYSEFS